MCVAGHSRVFQPTLRCLSVAHPRREQSEVEVASGCGAPWAGSLPPGKVLPQTGRGYRVPGAWLSASLSRGRGRLSPGGGPGHSGPSPSRQRPLLATLFTTQESRNSGKDVARAVCPSGGSGRDAPRAQPGSGFPFPFLLTEFRLPACSELNEKESGIHGLGDVHVRSACLSGASALQLAFLQWVSWAQLFLPLLGWQSCSLVTNSASVHFFLSVPLMPFPLKSIVEYTVCKIYHVNHF